MKYISVCSGIEAATTAWHHMGWHPQAFAEIEPFPSAVLKHHWPHVPNVGDFTQIGEEFADSIDLIVGGTPCQSFSVAGKRAGLDDPRGNLTLEFVRLCNRVRPRWILWENVPGVLSIDGGETFAAFIQALGECGYQCAWRILDAQNFGVPQRRRRVFVVGYFGDWRPAAAVLFESAGMCRDIKTGAQTGQDIAHPLRAQPQASHRADSDTYVARVAPTLNAHFGSKQGLENQHIDGGCGLFVTHTLRGEGYDASEDGTGRGTPLVTGTLVSNGDAHSGFRDEHGLVAFQQNASGELRTSDTSYTVNTNSNASSGRNTPLVCSSTVRRLTPIECERLQGVPDGHTLIPWRKKPAGECRNGPRYKAIGNSMAVPVMRWLGERIEMVDHLPRPKLERD